MDSKTIKIYNQVAQKWVEKYNKLTAKLLQKLAQKYFHSKKPTLEIGCGSGRDLGFLNSAGFPTTGLDASEGLLEECRKHSPKYEYILDSWPLLEKVQNDSFDNVYSSAVLMHLTLENVSLALENIFRILKDKGVFVFSYRHSLSSDEREEDGRLFTFIDPEWLKKELSKRGFKVLFYEAEEGPQGLKFWHHFVVEKS